MKVVFLFMLIALCSCVKWHELEGYTFQHFKNEFNPSYQDRSEEIMREKLFNQRLQEIRSHNSDPTKSWKKGVNRFTDRTDAEFKRVLGLRSELIKQRPVPEQQEDIDISVYQGQNIDWRDKGIISPVKDQGNCGSCWSFASSETFEAYWALTTGQLVELSEQQILDCTPNPNECGGTGGCGGATAELAYDAIKAKGGLATEWTYPYQSYFGTDFNQCRQNGNTPPFAKLSGYVNLAPNTYAPMIQHIATTGPLAVSVDASAWSSYETGVFNGCNQTNPDLDHAVQLVGIGTDPQHGDYWLVRNSWSPAWGEKGYIRLQRDSTIRCGIDLTPGDGDGCKNGPTQVTVCGTCGILFDALYPVVTK